MQLALLVGRKLFVAQLGSGGAVLCEGGEKGEEYLSHWLLRRLIKGRLVRLSVNNFFASLICLAIQGDQGGFTALAAEDLEMEEERIQLLGRKAIRKKTSGETK